MCGLNGIFAYNAAANAPKETELLATRDHMRARGPDGAGVWWTRDRRLGLGHRRLSIIDLNERANQPMACQENRYTIVFNGEIYNYRELRDDLVAQGHRFRTTGDTEVILQLYARYGAAMVKNLRGMFAFAIWDDVTRQLFLARDPYGIKPLYVADDGWTFRFASQVKALLAGGAVSRAPEPAGIVGFHLWGSVPEPFTLYRDIRALPAGHTQLIDAAGPRAPIAYANLAAELARPLSAIGLEATSAQIKTALLESVRCHLIADVEVGLFLSSGIDSGALLGLMRDAGQKKIQAVTITFEEFSGTSEDESLYAGEIARQYGAEHTIRNISPDEFAAEIPAILEAMDQPSIDGVNTYFVSKAAREIGLKVAVSGVGGDELLAGYTSFVDIPRWVRWARFSRLLPGSGVAARAFADAIGLGASTPKLPALLEYGASFAGAYLLKRGLFLPFELDALLDKALVAEGLRRLKPIARISANGLSPKPATGAARVAAMESTGYLRNQLLRDSDWAGMAHSIEIRTPLVDFELLRAVGPNAANAGHGNGKRILAGAASIPLPATIASRAKSGFGVPMQRALGAEFTGKKAPSKGDISRRWAVKLAKTFDALPPDTHTQRDTKKRTNSLAAARADA